MGKGLSREELLRVMTEAAAPAAAAFGLEVWGVELAGSGRPVARVFVDVPSGGGESGVAAGDDRPEGVSPEGVSVDQCAEISRMVGLALDVEEIFPDAWVLEVSSPGLERPFFRPSQMVPYIGREVDILLRDPHPDFPGRRKFRGELAAVDGDVLTLRVGADGSGECRGAVIPWDGVRRARLIHIFPDTSRPGQGKGSRSAPNADGASGQGGGKKA